MVDEVDQSDSEDKGFLDDFDSDCEMEQSLKDKRNIKSFVAEYN